MLRHNFLAMAECHIPKIYEMLSKLYDDNCKKIKDYNFINVLLKTTFCWKNVIK